MEIVLLFIMAAAAWLWFDSFQARESAMRAVKAACQAEELQLLDDTVALGSLKLGRNDNGRIQLRRKYEFEYSNTGNNRCQGSVVLLGHQIVVINVGTAGEPPITMLH